MTIQNCFVQLLSELRPTSAHLADATTKSDGVAQTLHNHYYEDDYTGATKRTIGSYGKATAVRPPRDVDILFQLPNEEYQRYKAYQGNGPSQLLQDVKGVLQARYSTTDRMRGDGHVVVIPFSGYHTVELLPAWKTMSGKYIVPDTHDGGSWKLVDQTAEMVNVDASNLLSNGATRPLIQLLKLWQMECAVPIKSLVLELEVVSFLDRRQTLVEAPKYSQLLVQLFAELVGRSGHVEPMPGTEELLKFGDAWLSRADSALNRAEKALRFELDGMYQSAVGEWQKVFGSIFE
jgi:hypothetical protein